MPKGYKMADVAKTGSVLDMILGRAVSTPDRRALGIRDGAGYSFITYGEVRRLYEGIAAALLARGIGAGERVALLLNDRAAWGLYYLGILRAGAVVVPLDNLQKSHEWASILAESKAAAVFVSSTVSDQLRAECDGLPCLANWIPVDTEYAQPYSARIPHDLTVPVPADWPAISGEMTAALVFTSGTTARPKGVILTHRNLASDVEAVHRLKLFDEDDCFLSVLPIHHTFECTVGFLAALALGTSVAYARSLKSREIIEDLQASRATIMLGVPLLFEKVANSIKRGIAKQPAGRRAMLNLFYRISHLARINLNARLGKALFRPLRRTAGLDYLRLVVSGAAPLAPDVSEFMDTIGLPILQGYGLTEASPALSVNPPQGYKYDSIGPPLPGVEMKIIDPDDSGIGEIAARGEMITPGYWNRPEETEKLFADGWLLTGDLGWKSVDGHFHISGRAKNVIVTPAGKNVYPEEIEMMVAESPIIMEALVFSFKPAPAAREKIGCAVVPDMEYIEAEFGKRPLDQVRQLVLAEVQKICSNLAEYKRPAEYFVRENEFEKTSTKKIKRFLFARTKEELFPLDQSHSGE
jgi:long-chain acyl-CoA synthetase